jgi:hypothetical protein
MLDINGIFDLWLKHYTTSKQLEITVINKNKALITTISHDHKKNPHGMGQLHPAIIRDESYSVDTWGNTSVKHL